MLYVKIILYIVIFDKNNVWSKIAIHIFYVAKPFDRFVLIKTSRALSTSDDKLYG